MPGIYSGLFSARLGLSAHGVAMAVIGDNIANVSTIGFKESRAEFADVLAGSSSRVTLGSGAQVVSTTQIFNQGTLEFTNRPLDLAIDGNGFFAVADGAERFYTRAGNFKIDPAGFIVTQADLALLGFPSGGTGSLQPINVNSISQDSVQTSSVTISGNIDASAPPLSGGIPSVSVAGEGEGSGDPPYSTTTYADLNDAAEFSTSIEIFDSLGASHTVTYFFFHTGTNEYTVRGYVNSEEVDGVGSSEPAGLPRLLEDATNESDIVLDFLSNGNRDPATTPATGEPDLSFVIPWNNGSNASAAVDVLFSPYTQFSAGSNVLAITQDGQGVGNVTSINIDKDGTVSALLDNGQKATIGQLGLVSFANPEALTRLGNQLLQQSTGSGEAVVGKPLSGTFGAVASGSVELSTVDIADQFVKLITFQRGFQANSRIITTINQLLNEIIQLA